MTETEALADTIALIVHTATAPLLAKIVQLEARPMVTQDWIDAVKETAADHRLRLIAVEARSLIPGPPGPAGERGLTGLDGKDGAPGLQGTAGAAGRDGLDGKDGAPGLQGTAGAAGRDGLDGKDGAPGLPGKEGMTGLPGTNGVGLMDAVLNRDGELILTLSDGHTKNIGRVVGQDGLPGLHGADVDPLLMKQTILDAVAQIPVPRDGRDGLGFDDLTVVFDETDGYRLRFQRGDLTKDFPLPVVWDAGVWQAGHTYPRGAGVTVKGAWWIAQSPTAARPGDETPASRAWRMAVKSGRDGKPGRDGRDRGDS